MGHTILLYNLPKWCYTEVYWFLDPINHKNKNFWKSRGKENRITLKSPASRTLMRWAVVECNYTAGWLCRVTCFD